jgi:hypothetical protein
VRSVHYDMNVNAWRLAGVESNSDPDEAAWAMRAEVDAAVVTPVRRLVRQATDAGRIPVTLPAWRRMVRR